MKLNQRVRWIGFGRCGSGLRRVGAPRQMPVSTPPNTILYSTVNVIGKIFTSRVLFVRAGEAAFLKTLKDPEFVAEAEKTRMTLTPIPGATLHNMIVED